MNDGQVIKERRRPPFGLHAKGEVSHRGNRRRALEVALRKRVDARSKDNRPRAAATRRKGLSTDVLSLGHHRARGDCDVDQ
jgi:hypothetical protein